MAENSGVISLVVLVALCGAALGQFNSQNTFQGWGGQADPFGRTSRWGRGNTFGLGGQRQRERPQMEYFTCIGRNTRGDQARITFTDEYPDNVQPWMRSFTPPTPTISANVSVGMGSQTAGVFQLVITQYGRVEDGCTSTALGNILDNPQPFNQFNLFSRRRNNVESGIIDMQIYLNSAENRNSQRASTALENVRSVRELNGRGMALCHRNAIQGGQCIGMIPLCCKIGRDRAGVTDLVMIPGFGSGLNGGFTGGFSGGFPGAVPGQLPGTLPGQLPGGLPGGLPGTVGGGIAFGQQGNAGLSGTGGQNGVFG